MRLPRFLSIRNALFLSGLLVFLYPSLAGFLNGRHTASLEAGYRTRAEAMEETETEQMLLAAERYNETLRNRPELFYLPDRIGPYREILNPDGSGLMGFVSVEKLGLLIPVYHGTEGEVLNEAAGHLEGSSFPVGGPGTHAVISAHRGLPSAPLFTDLPELSPGDRFSIRVLDRELWYEIDEIRTVLPEETEELMVIPGEDCVTLMTCTPYGINSHRLLVRGKRTESAAELPAAGGIREFSPEEEGGNLKAVEQERKNARLRRLPWAAAVLLTVLYFLKGGRKKAPVLLMALAFLFAPGDALAAEGTFSLEIVLSAAEDSRPVPGRTLALYQVGTGIRSGRGSGYILKPEWALSGAGLKPEESKDEKTAFLLAEEAERTAAPGVEERSDESGIVRFAGITPGLYLVLMKPLRETELSGSGDDIAAGRTAEMNPFLIGTPPEPLPGSGQTEERLMAYPKIRTREGTPPPGRNPGHSPGGSGGSGGQNPEGPSQGENPSSGSPEEPDQAAVLGAERPRERMLPAVIGSGRLPRTGEAGILTVALISGIAAAALLPALLFAVFRRKR